MPNCPINLVAYRNINVGSSESHDGKARRRRLVYQLASDLSAGAEYQNFLDAFGHPAMQLI